MDILLPARAGILAEGPSGPIRPEEGDNPYLMNYVCNASLTTMEEYDKLENNGYRRGKKSHLNHERFTLRRDFWGSSQNNRALERIIGIPE